MCYRVRSQDRDIGLVCCKAHKTKAAGELSMHVATLILCHAASYVMLHPGRSPTGADKAIAYVDSLLS